MRAHVCPYMHMYLSLCLCMSLLVGGVVYPPHLCPGLFWNLSVRVSDILVVWVRRRVRG